jgi:hypothetical protein
MVLNKTKKYNKYRNKKRKYIGIRKKQTKYTRLLRGKQRGGLENKNNVKIFQSQPSQKNLLNAYNNTIAPLYKNTIQQASNDPNFFGEIGLIVKKGLLNVIDNIGNYIGINFQNPADLLEINEQLRALKNTLQNTETLQELAIIGSLAVNATLPYIQPLIDKLVYHGSEAAEKIGKAIISVILNTLEAIPIYGIFVGLIRNINTIIVTYLSTTNTSYIAYQKLMETVNYTIDEFENLKKTYMDTLQKQKESSMNRVQKSVQQFQGGSRF